MHLSVFTELIDENHLYALAAFEQYIWMLGREFKQGNLLTYRLKYPDCTKLADALIDTGHILAASELLKSVNEIHINDQNGYSYAMDNPNEVLDSANLLIHSACLIDDFDAYKLGYSIQESVLKIPFSEDSESSATPAIPTHNSLDRLKYYYFDHLFYDDDEPEASIFIEPDEYFSLCRSIEDDSAMSQNAKNELLAIIHPNTLEEICYCGIGEYRFVKIPSIELFIRLEAELAESLNVLPFKFKLRKIGECVYQSLLSKDAERVSRYFSMYLDLIDADIMQSNHALLQVIDFCRYLPTGLTLLKRFDLLEEMYLRLIEKLGSSLWANKNERELKLVDIIFQDLTALCDKSPCMSKAFLEQFEGYHFQYAEYRENVLAEH